MRDDAHYLASADRAAKLLVTEFELSPSSLLIDLGCGQGRLAIGLSRVLSGIRYQGYDVNPDSLRWASRHITARFPNMTFHRLDVFNERYNPRGTELSDAFRLPLKPATVDAVNLYSVFTHFTERDTRIYLAAIREALKPGGRLFCTVFVEEGVEAFSINPPNYAVPRCDGPLHVVRYSREHFENLVRETGLRIDRIDHGSEIDGQSAVFASRS